MAEPLTEELFAAIGKLAHAHTYLDYHLSTVARLMAGAEAEEPIWVLFEGRSTEQIISDMMAMLDEWNDWPEKYLPPERPRIAAFRSTLRQLKILNDLRNEVIHGLIIKEPVGRRIIYPPWGKSSRPPYLFARSRMRKGVTKVTALTIPDIERVMGELFDIAHKIEDLYREAQLEREEMDEVAAEAALPEYIAYLEEKGNSGATE
ncbi:hypothetical protein ACFWHW_28935 [Streptomyces pharetrae]|uniref:hypothetical protein n=1 Tax=Streptomyces pharetrae TaxID=291370 RepID=UPI0036504D84